MRPAALLLAAGSALLLATSSASAFVPHNAALRRRGAAHSSSVTRAPPTPVSYGLDEDDVDVEATTDLDSDDTLTAYYKELERREAQRSTPMGFGGRIAGWTRDAEQLNG